MKNHRISVLGLIAVALFGGMAVAQSSVNPVPKCGNPQIQNDTLFIVNPCSVTVNVTYTSSGDIWGGTLIGPGQSVRTAYSGEHVNQVGGVQVYTCPGFGTPVQPDGVAIVDNYTGREYGCHGSAQDQSGLNSGLQIGQTPQQQSQQALSSLAPADPWNKVGMTSAGSDGVVQESNNVQQATDDDDDDAQDSDADNDGTDADQSAALQQEYQQEYQLMRQNLNAAMQEAARNAASRAGSGGGGYSSQCVSGPGYGRCR